MKPEICLGLDTSAYTTSIAAADTDGTLLADERIVLSVPRGGRGLRQSEAVYQHMKNMPVLFRRIEPLLSKYTVSGIGVSVRPENTEESFMPVFNAGITYSETASALTGAQLFRTSHQENHLEAAAVSIGCVLPDDFIGVHFSGGTSEILDVHRTDNGYECGRLAGSLDLKAGQLVDRTGVLLGLDFPAGRALEGLALEAQAVNSERVIVPAAMSGADFHFSGQENRIVRLLEEGADPGQTALGLFRMIAKTLERSLRILADQTGLETVLFSGGVMANGIIREQLERRLAPSGIRLCFSDPKYSSDNAVGNAYLALRRLKGVTEV